MSNGTVIQIIGAVIDVEFPKQDLPKIYDALKVDETGLVLEVLRWKEVGQRLLSRSGLHGGALLPGGKKTGSPVKHATGREAPGIG